MFGWGYAINHCISSFRKEQEEQIYKIYVSKCLRIITENTAKLVGIDSYGKVEATYLTVDFDEFINPKNAKKERTGDEIVRDVLCQLGLEVRE